MTPRLGKYYWIRLYRDDAPWQIAIRAISVKANNFEYCWRIIGSDLEYWDTEVNIIGPEIVPPPL
jgi:hypothetical protein